MKLNQILEQGSANPFVSLVASMEFYTNQLRGISMSPLTKKSLISQLANLCHILDSVKNWTVPEKDIRKNLDLAIPEAKYYVNSATTSIESGNLQDAEADLKAARNELVKRSQLKFG